MTGRDKQVRRQDRYPGASSAMEGWRNGHSAADRPMGRRGRMGGWEERKMVGWMRCDLHEENFIGREQVRQREAERVESGGE